MGGSGMGEDEKEMTVRQAAFGCFICGFVFALGVFGAVLALVVTIEQGTLPPPQELSDDCFALGYLLLVAGWTGTSARRWAVARSRKPGVLLRTFARFR